MLWGEAKTLRGLNSFHTVTHLTTIINGTVRIQIQNLLIANILRTKLYYCLNSEPQILVWKDLLERNRVTRSWFRVWLLPIILFFCFFSFIFISWRLITLQYCSGFCHTLTWINGFTSMKPWIYMCSPSPSPLPLPSPPHPSGSS